MIYLNIFLIAIICVCIIDISRFIDSVKYGISWILTKGKIPTTNFRLKPLDCSLCSTVWLGLIYLIIINSLSFLTFAYLLLIAVSTPLILDTILFLLDTYTKILKLFK